MKKLRLLTLTLSLCVPAAFACERDPEVSYRQPRVRCSYGDLNRDFQEACRDLYRTVARARNVIEGARDSTQKFRSQVAARPAVSPEQAAYRADVRGIAIAGSQTMNVNLSAAQLTLSNFPAVREEAGRAIQRINQRRPHDQAVVEIAGEARGAGIDPEEVRRSRGRLGTYERIHDDLTEGVRQLDEIRGSLRATRDELVAAKRQFTGQLRSLGSRNVDDAAAAADEDARTAQLESEDQGFWRRLYSQCIESNGVRTSCHGAIEGAGLISALNIFGGVRAAAMTVANQTARTALQAYLRNDTYRLLIQCGQGTAAPINPVHRESELGSAAPTVPAMPL